MSEAGTKPRSWLLLGGDPAARAWGLARQLERNARGFADAYAKLRKVRPDLARERYTVDAARLVARGSRKARVEILTHPLFGFWVYLVHALHDEGASKDAPAWLLAHSFLRGFAAAIAMRSKLDFTTAAVADAQGRVHLHGLGAYLEFGPSAAGKGVLVELRRGRPRAARLVRQPRVHGSVEVNASDPLVREAIREHGLLDLTRDRAFLNRLDEAFDVMEATDPALAREIRASLRLIVPLRQPKEGVSVSSSYRQLRWAVGLSHYNDPLVQAETLIHEFNHSKLYTRIDAAPLIVGGEGARYYSPLKTFARPLEGVLLGAHAFLSVARFYLDHLEKNAERVDAKARAELQWTVSRRLFEVQGELACVAQNADLSEWGARFVLEAERELGRQWERASRFPAATLRDAEAYVEDHRRRYSAHPSWLFRAPEDAPARARKRA